MIAGSNPNGQQQRQQAASSNNFGMQQQQQQQAVPVASGVFPSGLLAGTPVGGNVQGPQQGQAPMMQAPAMYLDSSNVHSMVSSWNQNQHGGVPLFQPVASAAQPAMAQSHISGESQVSHATNRVGQMHASASSSQFAIPPIPNEPVKLPKALNSAVGKVESMHHGFFQEYPDVWRKLQTSNKTDKDWEIIAKHYVIWYVKKIQQKKKLMAEEKAKQAKAGAQEQEELKQKTKSAQEILEDRIKKRSEEAKASMLQRFPTISKPNTADERRFVPTLRLQSLVRKVCGERVKLDKETEDAIEQITEKFVGDAIAFAISMARRKKLKDVDPSDIALFLRSTWNINIPGFKSGKVTTYRCIAPKPEERSKIAAVRKENFAEGKKYQVPGNQGDKDRSMKK